MVFHICYVRYGKVIPNTQIENLLQKKKKTKNACFRLEHTEKKVGNICNR